MNKQYGVVILSLISVVYGHAAVGVPKHQLKWNQYLNTQVPKEYRNKYHRFYNHHLDKQLKRKDENRAAFDKHNTKVRAKGMLRIEKKHPATFRDIADKITRKDTPKNVKNRIEKYIYREGLLADFLDKIEREKKTVWGLTKKYSSEAWQKMRLGAKDIYLNVTKPGAKKPKGKKVQSRRKSRKKK